MKEFKKMNEYSSVNPLEGANFELLKNQKKILIELLFSDNLKPEYKDAFQGLVNWIDHMQDYAIDQLGMPEELILDLKL